MSLSVHVSLSLYMSLSLSLSMSLSLTHPPPFCTCAWQGVSWKGASVYKLDTRVQGHARLHFHLSAVGGDGRVTAGRAASGAHSNRGQPLRPLRHLHQARAHGTSMKRAAHRQAGRQTGTGGKRGGHVRDFVCLHAFPFLFVCALHLFQSLQSSKQEIPKHTQAGTRTHILFALHGKPAIHYDKPQNGKKRGGGRVQAQHNQHHARQNAAKASVDACASEAVKRNGVTAAAAAAAAAVESTRHRTCKRRPNSHAPLS